VYRKDFFPARKPIVEIAWRVRSVKQECLSKLILFGEAQRGQPVECRHRLGGLLKCYRRVA
jgi:hypothetical protein